MFEHYLNIIIYDLYGFIINFTLKDAIVLIGVLTWVLILLIPIKGVDKKDFVAALTYMLVLMALGVCLVFAIPQHFFTDNRSLQDQFLITFSFGFLALCRWFLMKSTNPNVLLLHTNKINLSVNSKNKL